jgi:N-acyl-D-aspartate/D-glutamate deacylase
MECDLKLSGGQVIDGTGAAAFAADVAITGGRISQVGDLGALAARQTIDCAGKTITPGFIDIHSHGDFLVPWGDHGTVIEPFIRQGVTSLVTGNCGFSPAPVSDLNRYAIQEACKLLSDEKVEISWETMGQFLDYLEETGLALNIAELVGHGVIRAAVTGPLTMETPTPGQLAEMERLTKQALDDGCIGVSTGLGYAPGIFAGGPELTEVARWSARDGKLLTSHVRAYSWVSPIFKSDPTVSPHNLEAINEVMNIAKDGGARLQLSHLIFVGRNTWHTHGAVIEAIERAREDGLDVAFDAFPYTAGNTTASVLFPPEMLPKLEEILETPEQLEGIRKLAEGVFEQIGFNLDDIQIMNANTPSLMQYNGLYVGEAAKRAGMDVWKFYGRMVVESRRNARVLIHKYSGAEDEEEALRAVLAHPLCTIETDSIISKGGHQNPASYGTFPRALSTYVSEGLFTLEEAVHRMTGASAERLNWTDRGWVKKGCAADLVIVDANTLRDTATFEEPMLFPAGIEHVFINGTHVVDGDTYASDARAGQVLRA